MATVKVNTLDFIWTQSLTFESKIFVHFRFVKWHQCWKNLLNSSAHSLPFSLPFSVKEGVKVLGCNQNETHKLRFRSIKLHHQKNKMINVFEI